MVNWLSFFFLSAGLTLLVFALNLAFLKYEMWGGRKENLQRRGKNLQRKGWCIFGIGWAVGIAGLAAAYWQWLPSQEAGVLVGAAPGIFVTGLISVLRGKIQPQEREAQLKGLYWGMLTTVLIGVAFIAAFITCALKLCC